MKKLRCFESSDGQLFCLCPFHDDEHPSLHVSLDLGLAHCFAGCFSGTLVDLVAQLYGTNHIVAKILADSEQVFDIAAEPWFGMDFLVSSPSEWLGSCTKASDDPWFEEKNLHGSVLDEADVYSNELYAVFPLYTGNGELVTLIIRSKRGHPKYWYFPSGSGVASYFYGENFVKILDNLILVEGPLDVLYYRQHGIESALGVLGLQTSKEKLMILRRLINMDVKIVLSFDDDYPGRKGMSRLASKLGSDNVKIVKYRRG